MNDPLAYFLTWTTYGTWLPGDERGWVKNNQGLQPPSSERQRRAKFLMVEEPCLLDESQRALVERVIADHCRIRGWPLHAVNCRSNHVHVVVTAPVTPKRVMSELKSWCTRYLKEQAIGATIRQRWWTERGSCRVLFDDRAVEDAILYARDGQSSRRFIDERPPNHQ